IMEKMLIGSKETREFFVQALKTNKLVPILGAGFSCGMPARKGNCIPSGAQLKEYMIKAICNERKDFSGSMLKEKNFSWISERFFKCDIDKITDYFFDNFTGIKFTGVNKRKFLNEISWPYVYTLNVDTAIEASDNDWEVFYPNCKFINKSVFDKKKLYKIHGDINHFCKTQNIDDLIFSETQYIKSLEANTIFHDMLAADCNGKNLLYIGCSLCDEIDIKFSIISDRNRNISPVSARRIYVTAEDIESDPIKIEDLESFQITHYIKLDKNEDYELFYEFITNCYNESLKEAKNPTDYYKVEKIETLDGNRELNLQYLVNSMQESRLLKPHYFFEKSGFDLEKLSIEKINVFVGRRFSGKTMFAYNILDHFEDRKKYFISSKETVADKNLIS
ncbi:SIR2 family protein, partial [Mordavella massiliensis]|nr:SIR2 family protein [Mordavella massiliensis]